MRVRAVAVTVATAIAGLATVTPTAGATPVGDLLAQMTLREKVGQVVMATVRGTALSASDAALIEDTHLGGIILFGENYVDRGRLGRFTRALQVTGRDASGHGIGLLVSADQEGGVVKRFGDLAPFIGAPEVGSADEAREMGRATGRALDSVGVNLNLAPVADRDRGPARVMRFRAFGRAASTVALRIDAYLDGLLGTGLAGSLKHFPGLGAAAANTDDARVVVSLSRETIIADEQPFRTARGRARATIMVSNAIYSAFDPGWPASVSRRVISHLHWVLGPDPLVITDSLNAIAWAFDGQTPRACAAAIDAGADIALVTGGARTTRGCVERIIAGVRSGEIPRARLDEAVTRVLRLKRALGLLP